MFWAHTLSSPVFGSTDPQRAYQSNSLIVPISIPDFDQHNSSTLSSWWRFLHSDPDWSSIFNCDPDRFSRTAHQRELLIWKPARWRPLAKSPMNMTNTLSSMTSICTVAAVASNATRRRPLFTLTTSILRDILARSQPNSRILSAAKGLPHHHQTHPIIKWSPQQLMYVWCICTSRSRHMIWHRAIELQCTNDFSLCLSLLLASNFMKFKFQLEMPLYYV